MSNIQTFLHKCVEEGAFPGAAWQIGNKDGILERGAVGILGEELGPTDENTLYDLASLTKIIVTYALMRQFEEGAVRMEDTAGYFLPPYKGTNKADITLFELLTHTSVIPGQLQLYRHAHTREDLLEAIRWQIPRVDSPGTVRYTSKGYILLGEIISAVDTQPLDKIVERRVLKLLGMDNTRFNPPEELIHRIAPTETCPWRGKVVRGQVHDENAVVMGGVSGHAGLFAPVGDIAKAAAVMLDGKAVDGSAFLSPSTIRLMTQNHTKGKNENRGLGFMLAGPGSAAGDLMSPESFGHTGFTGTSMWVDPRAGLYAVLLSNRIHPQRDNDAIFRVRHILHNLVVLNYS